MAVCRHLCLDCSVWMGRQKVPLEGRGCRTDSRGNAPVALQGCYIPPVSVDCAELYFCIFRTAGRRCGFQRYSCTGCGSGRRTSSDCAEKRQRERLGCSGSCSSLFCCRGCRRISERAAGMVSDCGSSSLFCVCRAGKRTAGEWKKVFCMETCSAFRSSFSGSGFCLFSGRKAAGCAAECAKRILSSDPKPDPDGSDRRSAGSAGAEQRRRTDGRGRTSGWGKQFCRS